MTALRVGIIGAGDPAAESLVETATASPDCSTSTLPLDGQPAGLDAVIVAAADRDAETLRRVAAAGQTVIVAAPCVRTADDWRELAAGDADRLASVVSFVPERLHAPVAEARRIATSGEAGALFTMYLAHRARPDGPGLARLLFAAVDLAVWCAGRAPETVWAARRQAPDAVIAHLSFGEKLKATIEAAATLPAAFPAPVELEIELMCRDAALRVMPYDQSVTLYGAGGSAARPWFPQPAASVLTAIADGAAGQRSWREDGPVLATVEAIRRSADGAGVVELSV